MWGVRCCAKAAVSNLERAFQGRGCLAPKIFLERTCEKRIRGHSWPHHRRSSPFQKTCRRKHKIRIVDVAMNPARERTARAAGHTRLRCASINPPVLVRRIASCESGPRHCSCHRISAFSLSCRRQVDDRDGTQLPLGSTRGRPPRPNLPRSRRPRSSAFFAVTAARNLSPCPCEHGLAGRRGGRRAAE